MLLALSWAAPAPAAQPVASPLLLASNYHRGIHLRDWWVSEEYDGVRGYWDGRQLRTRGGEPIVAPAWFTAGWPATPMDGELWAGRGRFEQALSAVTRWQPDDAQWRALRYMVFDLPGHAGNFSERLLALNGLVTSIDQPWVQAAPQSKLVNNAELQALLRQVTHDGGAGLLLHLGASLYHPGHGNDLLKLQPYDDDEARVLAQLPGKGKLAGQLGALLVETTEGRRFMLDTGFSAAQRRDPPPIGSWVLYRYHGVDKVSGLPLAASFIHLRA